MSNLGALRRYIKRGAVVALLVAASVSIGAVPATAADGKATSGSDGHCVAHVVDQRLDGELVTGAEKCFGRFSDAMSYASGGELRLPADTPGASNNYGGMQTLMGNFTLAMHFDGYYGTGASITIVGGSCNGYWNTSSWWDNRISSTYNGCFKTRHYDLPWLGGSFATLSGPLATHNLPWTMNNRTESVRYLIN